MKAQKEVPSELVYCAACNELIGLRDPYLHEATGLAWFDPYVKQSYKGMKGAYVHEKCLSGKRKKEIAEHVKKENKLPQ